MSDYTFLAKSLDRVEKLQQDVFHMIASGITGDPTHALLEYFHTFYGLMEAQQCLVTRLQLMQLPETEGLISSIYEVTASLGRRKDQGLLDYHVEAKRFCLHKIAELSGESIEALEDVDFTDFDL